MCKFKNFLLISALTFGSLIASCSNEGNILQPGDKNITSVKVVEGTIPEEIIIGEFDEAGIQLLVSYSDETTDTITVTSEMVPEKYKSYLTTAGKHNITIFYRGVEVKITVVMIDYLKVNFYALGEDEEYYLFSSDYFKYGTTIQTPTVPSDVYSETKHYSFYGWDKDLTNVKKHTDLYAQYSSINYYNVQFFKADGTLISTQKIDKNASAVEPDEEARALEGYNFIGRDRSYLNVQQHLQIYGMYTKISSKYRLILMNSNNEIGTISTLEGYYDADEEVVLSCELINQNYFCWWKDEEGNFLGRGDTAFTLGENTRKITCEYEIRPDFDPLQDTFFFGEYPQTLATSEEIQAIKTSGTWSYKGYYELDGEKFYPIEKVPEDADFSTPIITDVTYYKSEPIEWKIVKEISNGKYLLLSKLGIEAHCFYNENISRSFQPWDYSHSDVRAFLNGYDGTEYSVDDYSNESFINRAFSNIEQSFIETSVVDNSAFTTDSEENQYCCENTNDKLFLLSYQDYLNEEYGFVNETIASETGTIEVTDYAYCQSNNATDVMLWTRSPYSIHDNTSRFPVSTVKNGAMNYSYGTYHKDYFIQPALVLNLN